MFAIIEEEDNNGYFTTEEYEDEAVYVHGGRSEGKQSVVTCYCGR